MLLSHTLLTGILDLAVKEIPSARAVVELMNEEGRIIFREVRENGNSDTGSIRKDVMDRVVEEKQPVITSSPHHSFRREGGVSQKSAVCLPLIIEKRLVGILYLDREKESSVFTLDELEFLIALSKPVNWMLKKREEFMKTGMDEPMAEEFFRAGRSEAVNRIFTLIDRVKDSDIPVFICGESGTGKELVARTIHESGARRMGKFVAVNCGAIPENLLESELFGYVRGAFTGAVKNRQGLIEEANGGTFFLDEVCDLSLNLQAKLLRLLQEKEIRRIGENRSLFVNGRFISATNKNIEHEIECGRFREDLYYRLKIITIELPPLRERREDIVLLLNHFLEKYCLEMERDHVYFSPGALELLIDYSWPGNVRELQNEIKRCLVLAGNSSLIKEECLSPKINPRTERTSSLPFDFFRARAEFEKRFLQQALARWNFNRTKTAEEVGLSRQGLFKLMKRHKMDVVKKVKIGRPKKRGQAAFSAQEGGQPPSLHSQD